MESCAFIVLSEAPSRVLRVRTDWTVVLIRVWSLTEKANGWNGAS